MTARKLQRRFRIDPRRMVGDRCGSLADVVLHVDGDVVNVGIIVRGIEGTHYIARHEFSASERLMPYSTANRFYLGVIAKFRRGKYRY